MYTGADGKQLTKFVIKPARIQFMILGIALLGFTMVGYDFILCWMGEEYISAYYIALIIMIPATVELTENVIVSVVLAENKNGFRTSVMAGVSVFNVILTIILVRVMGYMGAPIATAVSYWIGNIVIMNIYYSHSIKIDISYFVKSVLKGTGPALIATCVISYFIISLISLSGWIGFILKAVIIAGVYIILMFIFGLNKEEKQLVISLIKR